MNESQRGTAIIHIQGLRKTYGSGLSAVEALRGVDLDVPRGEFLSIVGPSGSGKSTLFHIVGGLTPPSAGEVVVGGYNLSGVGDAQRTELRRKYVSFVFQKFNLLPNLTARDNIRVALSIAGQPVAPFDVGLQSILGLLGIEKRLDHKPSEMSGGEQQRVAIARALATKPAILLADEPTGNLDSHNSTAVLNVLKDLNESLSQTILMITHNTDAAAYGHRIMHMSDGRLTQV